MSDDASGEDFEVVEIEADGVDEDGNLVVDDLVAVVDGDGNVLATDETISLLNDDGELEPVEEDITVIEADDE